MAGWLGETGGGANPPVIVDPATYAWSAIVVVAAGAASALIVRRRIDRLDLVGVLKARE